MPQTGLPRPPSNNDLGLMLEGLSPSELATLSGHANPEVAAAAQERLKASGPGGQLMFGLDKNFGPGTVDSLQPGTIADNLGITDALDPGQNSVLQGLGKFGVNTLGYAAEGANALGRGFGVNALTEALGLGSAIPESGAARRSLGLGAPTAAPAPAPAGPPAAPPAEAPGADLAALLDGAGGATPNLGGIQSVLDTLSAPVSAGTPIEAPEIAPADFSAAREALDRGAPQAPANISDIRQSSFLAGLARGGMQGLTELQDFGLAGLLYGAGAGGLETLAAVDQQERAEQQAFAEAQQAHALAEAELERTIASTDLDLRSENARNKLAVAQSNRDAAFNAMQLHSQNLQQVGAIKAQLESARIGASGKGLQNLAAFAELNTAMGAPVSLALDPEGPRKGREALGIVRAGGTADPTTQAARQEALSATLQQFGFEDEQEYLETLRTLSQGGNPTEAMKLQSAIEQGAVSYLITNGIIQ